MTILPLMNRAMMVTVLAVPSADAAPQGAGLRRAPAGLSLRAVMGAASYPVAIDPTVRLTLSNGDREPLEACALSPWDDTLRLRHSAGRGPSAGLDVSGGLSVATPGPHVSSWIPAGGAWSLELRLPHRDFEPGHHEITVEYACDPDGSGSEWRLQPVKLGFNVLPMEGRDQDLWRDREAILSRMKRDSSLRFHELVPDELVPKYLGELRLAPDHLRAAKELLREGDLVAGRDELLEIVAEYPEFDGRVEALASLVEAHVELGEIDAARAVLARLEGEDEGRLGVEKWRHLRERVPRAD